MPTTTAGSMNLRRPQCTADQSACEARGDTERGEDLVQPDARPPTDTPPVCPIENEPSLDGGVENSRHPCGDPPRGPHHTMVTPVVRSLLHQRYMELEELAESPMLQTPTVVTAFHSSVPVPIRLTHFAERLAQYTGYGSHGLAIAFALMMRRSAVVGELPNALTVHRLLLTCLTVGCKVNFDVFVSNGHVARIGGVPVAELNRMERALLAELGWRVIPTAEEMTFATGDVTEATQRLASP